MRTLLAVSAVACALALAAAAPAHADPLPAKPPRGCHSSWCEKVRDLRAVAKRIDAGLAQFRRIRGDAGSPMAAHATAIARAARSQGISPFAILGIAGKESTFGVAPDCPAHGGGAGNVYGLGSCGHAWTTIPLCGRRYSLASIDSYGAGALFASRFLRCLYGGADDTWGVWQRRYCVDPRGDPCPTWGSEVAGIIRQYFRSGPGLRWRDALEAVGR